MTKVYKQQQYKTRRDLANENNMVNKDKQKTGSFRKKDPLEVNLDYFAKVFVKKTIF